MAARWIFAGVLFAIIVFALNLASVKNVSAHRYSSVGNNTLRRSRPKQTHGHTAGKYSRKGGYYNINRPIPPFRTQPVITKVQTLKFAVVGDWGGPGREPQKAVARSMAAWGGSNLSFVVSTGDNMYEDGVDNVDDKKFHRNFESVYDQPELQVRWYMSLGNHDHGQHGVFRDVRAQVNYSAVSSRWFLPSPFYEQQFEIRCGGESFVLQLIVLDTYDVSPYLTRMTETQLRWLRSTLENDTRADWRVVVGHRPIFSTGKKHGSSHYMKQTLLPLLQRHGVALYLCGDDHNLQLLQLRDKQKSLGPLFVVSGAGARARHDQLGRPSRHTVFQSGRHGFVGVSLNRTGLSVSFVDRNGAELHRSEYRKESFLSPSL